MIQHFFLRYVQIPALKMISTKLLLTNWTRESQEVISKGVFLDIQKACKNDRKRKEILQVMKKFCGEKDFLNACQIPALDEILKVCGGEDCLYRNCLKSDKVAKILGAQQPTTKPQVVTLATLIQQLGWEADGTSAGPTQQDKIPRHLNYIQRRLRHAVTEQFLPEKSSDKSPWAWSEGSTHLENARDVVRKYIADAETKTADAPTTAEPLEDSSCAIASFP